MRYNDVITLPTKVEEGGYPLMDPVLLPIIFVGGGKNMRIAKHKYTKKFKKCQIDTHDFGFLENVVDDCDINGDLILREMTFPIGISVWNPKIIEV